MKGSIVALSLIMLCIVGLLSFFLREPTHSQASTADTENRVGSLVHTVDTPDATSGHLSTETGNEQKITPADCKDVNLQLESPAQIKTCINLLSTSTGPSIEHLFNLYSAWVVMDVDKALSHLILLPSELSSYLIYDVVAVASADDLNSVLSWLESQTLETHVKSDLVVSAYVGASAHNQASILSLAESLTNPQLKTQVIDSILVDWAKQDYNAVLAWIDGRERPDMYHAVANKLLLNMIEQQPAEALYYLELMPENPTKTKLIEHYAHVVAKQDLTSAIAWAQNLDNPTLQAAALTSILDLAVSDAHNHQFVLQFALTESTPSIQQQLLTNIAHNIVNQDITWLVERFDVIPANYQADIARIIMNKWMETDEDAAINWADSLTNPASQKAAKEKYK
ncbi:hypothetical protein [Catenovulum sediminis]|uniref:hypothetical protein n=1 Tax=Catenovulum sediminis TaxID=1740262 RepID=UPI00117EAAAC|nr:hypothetical protein [Catenovulum sediminis]